MRYDPLDVTRKPTWPLELLQDLGVTFEIDFDDRLQFTVPDVVMGSEIESLIRRHEAFFARSVEGRARVDRCKFMGGPFAGQQRNSFGRPGKREVLRTGSSRWAVYEIIDYSGRAVFRGYATSQAKGRKGIISKEIA